VIRALVARLGGASGGGVQGAVMLLAGVLHTAAFAPSTWWFVQLLAAALLAAGVAGARPLRAFWLGWCFCLGWLVSGLWWLYISMHDFGGMPAALAALAVVALCAALSLYLGLAMALAAWCQRGRALGDSLVFAACWAAAELARAQLLTGFPWIASGYAHTDGPLASAAPWVGVYGMGLMAALVAAALAALARATPGRWAALAVALVAPLVAVLAPHDFTRPAGKLRVSLLQPNVAQDQKFDAEHLVANMLALQQQVVSATGQLVITPESVLPLAQSQLDPDYWASLTAPFRQGDRAALIGTFLGSEEAGYVNSLAGVSAAQLAHTGDFYRYGKRHLLPFGEFVPPGFRWLVDLMQIPLGDQASGTQNALFEVAGQRVRPLICYEDLFGEDFAASTLGPQSATVLANATNLAWFGRLMVQDQHLQFSRLRALELQRPLVRATNTGATAAVDYQGRVTARLPAWQVGVLDATVEGRSGSTPYARWVSAWGLWPLWGLIGLLLLLGGARRRAP
jgi:apolipoprotein N-acyltransferase